MTESLADYVSRKRGARSREDVCEQAKRRGFEISQAYIKKIEDGETKSPSVDKLDALAAGLGVDPDILVSLARGKELRTPQPGAATALDWNIPDDIPDPVDDWERAAMKRIEHIDWGDLDPRHDNSFWYLDRASRRRDFRFWEQQAEDLGARRKGRA